MVENIVILNDGQKSFAMLQATIETALVDGPSRCESRSFPSIDNILYSSVLRPGYLFFFFFFFDLHSIIKSHPLHFHLSEEEGGVDDRDL